MSNLSSFNIENTVQPITDDFSSDGMLDEFSRVDHQHPLSESLRKAIYNSSLYASKALVNLLLPTPWVAIATLNGTWVNYGGGYQAVQYRKVYDEVQGRGLIKSGTTGTSVYTLPVGFRPPATCEFVQGLAGGSLISIGIGGVITVYSTNTTEVMVNFMFSTTP